MGGQTEQLEVSQTVCQNNSLALLMQEGDTEPHRECTDVNGINGYGGGNQWKCGGNQWKCGSNSVQGSVSSEERSCPRLSFFAYSGNSSGTKVCIFCVPGLLS